MENAFWWLILVQPKKEQKYKSIEQFKVQTENLVGDNNQVNGFGNGCDIELNGTDTDYIGGAAMNFLTKRHSTWYQLN